MTSHLFQMTSHLFQQRLPGLVQPLHVRVSAWRLLAGCFALCGSLAAETLTWAPESPQEYAAFARAANWRTPDGAPAKAAPGTADFLADGASMRLDLGGAEHRVAGWTATRDWSRLALDVRNGTLAFTDAVVVHGASTTLEAGGALVFEAGALFHPGVNDAGSRHITVRDGARFEMRPGSRLELYHGDITVEPGGEVRLSPETVRISGGQRSTFENAGAFRWSGGLDLAGDAPDARLELIQRDGTMLLDGAFVTNRTSATLSLELRGGTLSSAEGACFDGSSILLTGGVRAAVPAGVTLALPAPVQTLPGGALEKTGAGTLALGNALPPGLTVREGTLALTRGGPVSGLGGVRFEPGATLCFAADGIILTEAPPAGVRLDVDVDAVGLDRIVMHTTDADVMRDVAGRLQEPLAARGCTVSCVVSGGDCFLRLEAENARTLTVPAGKKPVRLEPPAQPGPLTVTGGGTGILSAAAAARCTALSVGVDTTLVVTGDAVLPMVTLAEGARLLIGHPKAAAAATATGRFLPAFRGAGEVRIVHGTLTVGRDFSADGIRVVTDGGRILLPSDKPLFTWVDTMNRCFHLDAEAICADAAAYTFEYPDFSDAAEARVAAGQPRGTVRTAAHNHRFHARLPKKLVPPFPVRVEALRADGVTVVGEGIVQMRPERLSPPAENHEILVGHTVYDGGRDPVAMRFRDEIVDRELCNLIVMWTYGPGLSMANTATPARAAKAKADNLRFMTIYAYDGRPLVEDLKREHGTNYLMNNIGEFAGYLYQGPAEAAAVHTPQQLDTRTGRMDFVERFIGQHVRHMHRSYDFILSTSGSPLANYELEGGIEYICNELYAVGSHNLAYASSEARGASRRWGPEYWSSWLAEEWQTFPVPYHSMQKYALLLGGYYQQYVMGTSLIVLESGAQQSQAQNYTRDAGKVVQYYDDFAPTQYRAVTKWFYDFVRRNPRARGTPETKIAFVLGDGDAYVGMNHENFAVWGQHEQAVTNRNWRYGAPEQTWQRIQQTFFPLQTDVLAPYANYWLAGSPYGQCDVVCVDDSALLDDVRRYALLAFAGWNTLSDRALQVLDAYVAQGGTLVMGLPHASTRTDREYSAYTLADVHPQIRGRLSGQADHPGGAVRAEPAAGSALSAALEGLQLGPLRLATLTPEARKACRVLASVGETPLLVEERLGKGRRIWLLAWDYPGADPALGTLYTRLLTSLAEAVPQAVTIAPFTDAQGNLRDDTRTVCYASYGGKTAYFTNLDATKVRAVDARLANGRVIRLTLEPMSVVQMNLADGTWRTISARPYGTLWTEAAFPAMGPVETAAP